MSAPEYRLCVGICLINREGKIFAGERLDNRGAWQMPQGGIDEGEDIEIAARRELREEIGTDNIVVVGQYPEALRYDVPEALQKKLWGGKYRGQEQTWVYAMFAGEDSEIDLNADKHPEFAQWAWLTPDEIKAKIVPFKMDIYEKVLSRTAF